MNRETFEQLVSQWLDQPEREELRLRVEAAAAQSDELTGLKEEWLRLDRLVRGLSAGVNRVDWPRFRQRIAAAIIKRQGVNAGFEETLRRATAVAQGVDWSRLRKRISQAVASADGQPPVIRFPLRRLAAGVALVGAAAALVFMLVLPAKRPTAAGGFARLRVSAPARALESRAPGSAFARVSVAAPAEVDGTIDETQRLRTGSAEPQLAEVFLMVGPARFSRDTRGPLIPFGFN